MHRNVILILAVLVFAACLGEKEIKPLEIKPFEIETKDLVYFKLDPDIGILLAGEEVTYDFSLKLKEPAPQYVSIKKKDGKGVDINVTPEKIQVINGEAKGELIFRVTPALRGSQSVVLSLSDAGGKFITDIALEFEVLPPGAS